MDWQALSDTVLAGGSLAREEALAVLAAPDDELLSVLDAAYAVRLKHWGKGVRLHVLQNAKSGMCQENCSFCSQSVASYSGVDNYRMKTVDEIVDGARKAYENHAVKYCIVTATRGPSEPQLETVCEAVRTIKRDMPIKICTSLGLLNDAQAAQLVEAGVDRFNHNLETSERYYPEVCQTHTYQDRMRTLQAAKRAGMELCCGGIMGMGETLEDRVDLALALRELAAESIPVNFLDPRPGTPMADVSRLTPADCLRCLCMFRLTNPEGEIRVAGGREANLRHMQPLALYPANSMFTQGYLTTPGQGLEVDEAMIADAGLFIEELVED